MDNISRYHKYLFLGKITNSLSDSEKEELERLFAQNKQAEEEYLLLINSLPAEDVATAFSRFNKEGFWRDLPSEALKKNRRLRQIIWLKRSAVAALLLGVFASAWILWNNQLAESKSLLASGKQNNFIKLVLPDGKSIDLSKTKGTITTELATLNNTGETLVYDSKKGQPNGVNKVEVPVGMNYNIKLSDGSEVWMNSMTTLTFPTFFEGSAREITIEGEAYLSVAKNASKPFIVHLPDGDVDVLGTQFNVNSYESQVAKVALVEGKINFRTNDSTVAIKPGMQIEFNKKSGSVNYTTFEARKVLSWRSGLFYFEKTSLNEIADVIYRWYGIKTIADDPVLFSRKFSGVLDKNKPLEAFLENITTISKLSTYFDKDGVLHFK